MKMPTRVQNVKNAELKSIWVLMMKAKNTTLMSDLKSGFAVDVGVDGGANGVVVGVVALARQGDHLRRGGVHGRHLRVDALLVACLLRLLPAVGGGVVAQRGRQLGLLVEQVLRLLDGLLTLADGRDQRSLGAREGDLIGVLGLGERDERGFLGMAAHYISRQGLGQARGNSSITSWDSKGMLGGNKVGTITCCNPSHSLRNLVTQACSYHLKCEIALLRNESNGSNADPMTRMR